MDLGLADARVVIVGASRGIGRAAARRFAAEGAKVALIARSPKGLEKTAALCRGAGSPDVLIEPVDMVVSEQINTAFHNIGERWGAINVLVNNAANSIGTHGEFEKFDAEDNYLEAYNRIALGYVRSTRAALPYLKSADWGRIVNVSSASTPKALPILHVYNMAKSAVVALSKANAREFAPFGISVNALSPGGIMVEGGNWGEIMNGYFAETGLDPHDAHDAFKLQVQKFGNESGRAWMRRLGYPQEYAAAICWLGCRTNSFMTGVDMFVTGGSD